MGNIRESSLDDIWAGKPLWEFRRMQIEGDRSLNPSCSNCKDLYGNPDSIGHVPKHELLQLIDCK